MNSEKKWKLLCLFTLGAWLLASVASAQAPQPVPLPTAGGHTKVPVELFQVPDGLEVTVWATLPMLNDPTNIDIDHEGRIWVAEGVNYRAHFGRRPEGDRIVILEDTNKDGRADKSSVFVQEPDLIAPLGIAVIDNQIVVSNTPDLIVYTDVNRNGVFEPQVDRREVLLTGFAGRNHDHGLHSVTFGPDGHWYFSHGNTGALFTDRSGRTFRVGGAYNPMHTAMPLYGWQPSDLAGVRSDDGHVYLGGFTVRVRPDGTRAEIIGHNFRNSYEQTVTSFGDVFQNDNDDPRACRTTFLMEYGNLGFFSRDGQRRWIADRRPGQARDWAQWRQDDPGIIPAGDIYGGGAPTGIVFYEGDALGERWRGLLLSADAARNTVLGYFPKLNGAGYELERFEFLTSNPEGNYAGADFVGRRLSDEIKTYFRPSDVAVGPDGAIYVADWFDPRVGGHGAFDENSAGTIYRIAPKGFKSVVPQLDLDTIEGQIGALKSPAVNVRAIGFMRLRDRGASAIPAVSALLQDPNPFIRPRAVWLLAHLGRQGISKVEEVLRSDEPMMRVTAFRALRRIEHRVLEHARVLAQDPSPAVRREVALAMRDVPLAQSREILLALARGYDGHDRSYLEAWGIGCSNKEAAIYADLAAQKKEKDPAKWSAAYAGLVWRLTPKAAVPAFATRARAPALDDAQRVAAVTALGFVATREAGEALIDLAVNSAGQAQVQALWWLVNYRNSLWKELDVAGTLKAEGVYDPDAITLVSTIVPVPEPSKLPPAAEIALLKGDAVRGARAIQSCYACHRVGGAGIDYGPDLTGWARRQTTEMAILAIVDPSADIAHGFDAVEVVTTDGLRIHGLPITESDPVMIRSMGGLDQTIPRERVQALRPLRRSAMLSADQLGLSAQDVADIVAFMQEN